MQDKSDMGKGGLLLFVCYEIKRPGLYPSYLQDRVRITVYTVYHVWCFVFLLQTIRQIMLAATWKQSYNAYYILFIFIDNTYTCTYVVSRLFAPRTINYIQVVLPVNMWYVLQSKHYERGHENHRCMSMYKKKLEFELDYHTHIYI